MLAGLLHGPLGASALLAAVNVNGQPPVKLYGLIGLLLLVILVLVVALVRTKNGAGRHNSGEGQELLASFGEAPIVQQGIPAEVVAAIAAAVAQIEGGKYTLHSVQAAPKSKNRWGMAAALAYTEPF